MSRGTFALQARNLFTTARHRVGEHVGIDIAGAQGVDPDVWDVLQRGGLAHAGNRVFAGS